MEIRIESLIAGAREAEGVVVVIDVFRCFTTEAVAFANGAKEIILVAEIGSMTLQLLLVRILWANL